MNINPISALIYAAIINCVVAVPMLFVILKTANNKQILHHRINGKISNILGWFTFCLMGLSVAAMFVFFILNL
jgi:Mn2+/Fe2+ NRAMP family transporter